MEAIDFLKNKGITKATCYTDGGTYYVSELAKLMEEYAALCQPLVSGWVAVSESLPQTDGTYFTFTKNKVSESIGFTLFVDGQFMSSFVTHWAVVEKPDH